MKKYLQIYFHFLRLNLFVLLNHRINFINSVVSSIGWSCFSIAAILLLTAKNPSVYGWTRDELLILIGCVNIFLGLFRSIFSKNFERFARAVDLGELDNLLIKPIDSQFLLSFSYINYGGFIRVFLSMVFVWYILSFHLNISITIFDSIFFILFLILGISILYFLWFIILTLTIWYPHLSNINALMYSIDSVIRYPQQMFRQFGNILFFLVFPLTLVVAVPSTILLHKITLYDVLTVLITVVISGYLSRTFWKFALRYYSSASS